jgi:ABC-type multidrug transport system fused ATPase/permease subunit
MNLIKEILYLLDTDKNKLPWIVLLFLAFSIIDVIGVGLMAPYISSIINPEIIQNEYLQGIMSVIGVSWTYNNLIILLSLSVIFIFIIKSIAGIFIFKLILNFAYNQQIRLRSKLMRIYQSLPYIRYVERNSSEYVYAIQNLVSTFTGKIVILGLKTASDIIVSIAIISVLAWKDFNLLLLLLTLVLFVGITYDRLIRIKIQISGKHANIASTKLVKTVNEGIAGMKELRILGKAEHFEDVVLQQSIEYAENMKRSEILTNIPRYLIESVMIFFLALTVIVELILKGDLIGLVPTLAMFVVASLKLVPAANSISSAIVQFRFNRNTISLLYQDIKEFNEFNEFNELEIIGSSSEEINQFNELNINSVSFQYPNANEQVIKSVSLNIKKGETIGLIGQSGSGKTTLIDIIIGLISPQEGSIFVNGRSIDEFIKGWQSMIAYLPQQVLILDDTVKNNIALGIIESEIDEDRLHDAIYRSRLSKVIEKLPKA